MNPVNLWVFCLLAMLWSCGKSERPSIGNRLDAPIALDSHPSRSVYYVLNASLSGEYRTGSLQAFRVPVASSDAQTPLATLEVPRLGTALAVAKTGDFLVAGFSGTVSELRVLDLNAEGTPSASPRLSDVFSLPEGRVSHIQINAVEGQSDLWSVVVSLSDRSLSARVVVLKYSRAQGFSQLADFPNDFYTPSRDNPLGLYAMVWGVPVVFPTQGLVVLFPQGTGGYFGKNPSAFDWLKGLVSMQDKAFDLRTVSAAVIDLKALLAGKTLSQALGFFPIAFNSKGAKANPANAADSVGNADYQFSQNGFQSSLALDPDVAACRLTGAFTSLPTDTAVLATNTSSSDIIAVSGWNQLGVQLRNQLAEGQVQPFLRGDLLTPSPIQLTADVPSLVGIRTFVPSIQVVSAGGQCALTWIRIEQARASLGRELSRIQVATDVNAAAQLSRDSDLTGMAGFTVNGSSIMASSFSDNKVQVLRLNGATLDNVGVFQP